VRSHALHGLGHRRSHPAELGHRLERGTTALKHWVHLALQVRGVHGPMTMRLSEFTLGRKRRHEGPPAPG